MEGISLFLIIGALGFCGYKVFLFYEKAQKYDLSLKENTEISSKYWVLKNSFDKELALNKASFVEAIKNYKADLESREAGISKREKIFKEKEKGFQVALEEKTKGFPWISSFISDYFAVIEENVASSMKGAFSSSEKVRAISREKKKAFEELLILKGRMAYYESCYPWLKKLDEVVAETPDSLQNEISNISTYQMDKFLSWQKSRIEEADRFIKEQEKAIEALDRAVNIEISQKRAKFELSILERESSLSQKEKILSYKEGEIQKMVAAQKEREKTNGFPWIAQAYADYFYALDKKCANDLETKNRPAKSAAEDVKRVASEKRFLEKELKVSKYLLEYYESLFPWLPEYKDIDDEDIKQILTVQGSFESDIESDPALTFIRHINPQDYQNLTIEQKCQLALDKYISRSKSNWAIGRDYERYIGYLYEKDGYIVKYNGALAGYEDMGRDLIATKKGETLIVQCKNWSQRKTIHEKHIFQLYGTTIEYSLRQKLPLIGQSGEKIKPIFVTTCGLSDFAQEVANALGVEVKNTKHSFDYPMVKCNVSSNSDKIFHLPFDQQYDKIVIESYKGEFYTSTIEDAISKGFRRAYKWKGTS